MAKKSFTLPRGGKTNAIPRVGGGFLRVGGADMRGRPRLGGELPPTSGGGRPLGRERPPVSGKKTNAIPRVIGKGNVMRTRTPPPPRASSTSMGGGGGVQGMSKPRPSSTSMGGAGTSVQGVSGPRAKPRASRNLTAAMFMLKPKRGK